MKLQQALEIGDTCGLATPPECVNNILLHAGNLFAYTEAEEQIKELIADAAAAGIEFCFLCGTAKKDGNCYMAGLMHRDPM
jgi:hypothetical protein